MRGFSTVETPCLMGKAPWFPEESPVNHHNEPWVDD